MRVLHLMKRLEAQFEELRLIETLNEPEYALFLAVSLGQGLAFMYVHMNKATENYPVFTNKVAKYLKEKYDITLTLEGV